jgi:N-acetylmuramoyl-L-alanine amidase
MQVLQRADKIMKHGTKSEKFRAYNDYRNLYLRSMMNEDKDLKIESLRGIVKSGEELHIDVSDYKHELQRVDTKVKKRKIDVGVPAIATLKNARWSDNKLTLTFNKKLASKDIKHFTMRSRTTKHYKYIFDIHSATKTHSFNLKKYGILRVIVAQYKSYVLRLVLEDRNSLNIKYTISSNKLILTVDKKSKKRVIKQPKTVTKDVDPLSKYISVPKRLDRDKVIVIDAGHGGKDPGATGFKRYREKNVVLSIAKRLRKILKARGYKVYLTRSTDDFVKLSNRTKFANKRNADIFVSIHANAVPKKYAKKAYGIECYFLAKSRSERAKSVAATENRADISEMNFYGKESFLNTLNSHNIVASNKLAIDLQRGMLGSLKKSYRDVHDAGVREGPFWVLVGAQMPSVLVEVGFITHPKEVKRLISHKYQQKLALGLANGIERYFLNN